MPYYSALPEYKPVTAGPFTSLIGGFAAGQGIQERGARAALEREALVKSQNERAALQKFQQTGDPNVLTSVMTPQQAMMAKEAHTQAQIETGLATSKYFDDIKPNLTWENYPKIREDAIKQFPAMGQIMFPAPETIGSKGNFEKWKWEKAQKLAQFKALPQVIAAQSRLDAAKITGEYGLAKARETGASRERAAETAATSRIGAAKVRAGAPAKPGQITPFKQFITDPEIAKLSPAEQVRQYNQSFTESRVTPLQREKVKGEELKNRLLKKLETGAPSTEKPEGGPYYLRNKRTGQDEEVTKEQYEQVMGKQ